MDQSALQVLYTKMQLWQMFLWALSENRWFGVVVMSFHYRLGIWTHYRYFTAFCLRDDRCTCGECQFIDKSEWLL